MLVNCGILNDRNIFYCDVGDDLAKTEEFPASNWLLFAIADKDQLAILNAFAEKCLDRGVLYICGAGEAGSQIDDAFDWVVLERKLADSTGDLAVEDFDDSPMTTWHTDFDEGFWFAGTTAFHEPELIQQIVVANLTQKSFELRIRDLVKRINAGWLPSD